MPLGPGPEGGGGWGRGWYFLNEQQGVTTAPELENCGWLRMGVGGRVLFSNLRLKRSRKLPEYTTPSQLLKDHDDTAR